MVVSLIGLQLQDGGLGGQNPALKQVYRGKDFVVGYWTQNQVEVVTAGFSAVRQASSAPVK